MELTGYDTLVKDLGKLLDDCCNEIPNGCDSCPVVRACMFLWKDIENKATKALTIKEYRIFCQRFYALKKKRDRVMVRRRGKAVDVVRR